MPQVKKPNSRVNLDKAIDRLCAADGTNPVRMRRLLAAAIIGQMLPDGVAKGGNALKIRFGSASTRFSRDLDTARASSLEGYVSQLEERLEEGWNGFTGTVVPREPASPKGVPAAYIMRPFDLKLYYNQKPWMTLPLEVGHNEIGDADDPEMVKSAEVAEIMLKLGFPEPGPVPCMKLEHQLAQKLHAVSAPGSERAHDLIDLQIAVVEGDVDYARAKAICVRLFDYRQEQSWPPVVTKRANWDSLYAEQSDGLNVLSNVDEAVEWVNALIAAIDNA